MTFTIEDLKKAVARNQSINSVIPSKVKERKELEEQVSAYLAAGGKITVLPAEQTTVIRKTVHTKNLLTDFY